METPEVLSVYAPRHVTTLPLVDIGGWSVKPYWISPEPGAPDEGLVDRAMALAAPALDGAPGHGAGFLIVHRGEMATWVILWWWSDGDVLRRRIWQLGDAGASEVGDQHFVACVWELSIVDWERKAWINHVLRHPRRARSSQSYLDAVYPSDFC